MTRKYQCTNLNNSIENFVKDVKRVLKKNRSYIFECPVFSETAKIALERMNIAILEGST